MAGRNEDRVLASAAQVFLRYGFKKTTMGDLADAAQMSRPALYLVFPSKTEVFAAAVAQVFAATLDEIRAAVAGQAEPRDKLRRAFDIWCVRPYEMILAAPDSRDLLESSYSYAPEATAQAFDAFAVIVADVLSPLAARQGAGGVPPDELAALMSSAVIGFKATARSADALRAMIDRLLTVVLASLALRA